MIELQLSLFLSQISWPYLPTKPFWHPLRENVTDVYLHLTGEDETFKLSVGSVSSSLVEYGILSKLLLEVGQISDIFIEFKPSSFLTINIFNSTDMYGRYEWTTIGNVFHPTIVVETENPR